MGQHPPSSLGSWCREAAAQAPGRAWGQQSGMMAAWAIAAVCDGQRPGAEPVAGRQGGRVCCRPGMQGEAERRAVPPERPPAATGPAPHPTQLPMPLTGGFSSAYRYLGCPCCFSSLPPSPPLPLVVTSPVSSLNSRSGPSARITTRSRPWALLRGRPGLGRARGAVCRVAAACIAPFTLSLLPGVHDTEASQVDGGRSAAVCTEALPFPCSRSTPDVAKSTASSHDRDHQPVNHQVSSLGCVCRKSRPPAAGLPPARPGAGSPLPSRCWSGRQPRLPSPRQVGTPPHFPAAAGRSSSHQQRHSSAASVLSQSARPADAVNTPAARPPPTRKRLAALLEVRGSPAHTVPGGHPWCPLLPVLVLSRCLRALPPLPLTAPRRPAGRDGAQREAERERPAE